MATRLHVSRRVERDNRTAFTVQLHSLLSQLHAITGSASLNVQNKSKLVDITKTVEKWLDDLTPISSARVSITNGEGIPVMGEGDSQPHAREEEERPLEESVSLASSNTGVPKEKSVSPQLTQTRPYPVPRTSPYTGGLTFSVETMSDATIAIPTSASNQLLDNTMGRQRIPSLQLEEQPPTQQQNAKLEPNGVAEDAVDLTQVAHFVSRLFVAGLPEFIRLRAIGKSTAQLLLIRAFSVMHLSAQNLLRLTYKRSPVLPSDGGPFHHSSAPQGEEEERGDGENGDDDVEQDVGISQQVVARELRVSTTTVRLCLEILARNTPADDPASVRFTMKTCADAIKQVRKVMGDLQVHLVVEEVKYHRQAVMEALEDAGAAGNVDRDNDDAENVWEMDDNQRVRERVEAIRRVWGVCILSSIENIRTVISTAVRYIVSVASSLETGAVEKMLSLKRDAKGILFNLAELACNTTLDQLLQEAIAANYSTADADSGAAEEEGETKALREGEAEQQRDAADAESTEQKSVTTAAARNAGAASSSLSHDGAQSQLDVFPRSGSDVSPAGAANTYRRGKSMSVSNLLYANPRISSVAVQTVHTLTSSLVHDLLPALARESGDGNEGQLVCLKLVQDIIVFLSENEVDTLHKILVTPVCCKTLMNGLANCVVSPLQAVLVAALECLFRIVSTSLSLIGQEVGFVYTNCVYRMLESEFLSAEMKKVIVAHLIRTFLQLPRERYDPPVLLRIFYDFDLNVRLHNLNLVQHFVAALAKIVRLATPEEFITPVPLTDAGSDSPSPQVDYSAAQTLPFMALHGLVLVVELLTTQLPRYDSREHNGTDGVEEGNCSTVEGAGTTPEDRDIRSRSLGEVSRVSSPLKRLHVLPNREEKLRSQRYVDVINSSPLKGIVKMFDVTPDELNPPGYYGAVRGWEAVSLPEPATPALLSKVETVARFLLETPSLNPSAIGEFLSEPVVFSLQVCQAFMRELNLAGLSVIAALEELLTCTDLPREGQRIERLLEFFCQGYYAANTAPGIGSIDPDVFPFADVDAALVVVAATVMLNTDLHNPRVENKMTKDNFRSQLRRCNGGRDFSAAFTDSIYYAIAGRPLANVKSSGVLTGTAAPPTPASRMDLLFFSVDERKEMAFGIERQRMVQEAQAAVMRHSKLFRSVCGSWRLWSSVARDLFLSTWPSLCVVFGVAMQGSKAADQVLWRCVKGLQSCLCVASAFELQTEGDVTLMTLLRVGQNGTMQDICARAALVVAATEHSIHYTAQCWSSTMQIMIDAYKEHRQRLNGEIEGALSRIEDYTLQVCERQGPCEEAEVAVEAVLRGVVACLKAVKRSDGLTLSAGLYILRRVLSYSVIARHRVPSGNVVERAGGADIEHRLNIGGLHSHVLRSLITLIIHHGESDECLQVFVDFVVDILYDMWQSLSAAITSGRMTLTLGALLQSTTASTTAGGGCGSAEQPKNKDEEKERRSTIGDECGGIDAGMQPDSSMRRTSLLVTQLVTCFNLFRFAFDHQKATTLVRMHMLRGVKELVSRTLRIASAAVAHEGSSTLQLYIALSVWKRMVYLLARAMSSVAYVNSEMCSVAALILSNLVVLSCGTGSNATMNVLPAVRTAFAFLLVHVAYVGAMCSSTDTASTCLSQLTTLCTTALNREAIPSPDAAGASRGAMEGLVVLPVSASPAEGDAMNASKVMSVATENQIPVSGSISTEATLLLEVIRAIKAHDDLVVLHTLERLCLLLRCEKQATRTDAVESLGTLSMQLMQSPQLHHLVVHMCDVVLEASLGHASSSHHTPMTDPSLVSFLLFNMEVPTTMKKCSRTAFRATLPPALNLMTHDLLDRATLKDLPETAAVIVERCLTPLIVSPRVCAFEYRSLAMRSLMQCVALCIARQPRTATVSGYPSQSFYNSIALILSSMRIRSRYFLPQDARFAAREWLDSPPVSLTAYEALATQCISRIAEAEPADISCRRYISSLHIERDCAMPANASTSSSAPVDANEGKPAYSVPTEAREADAVMDEALSEYCTLASYMLAPLPKILAALPIPSSSPQSSIPAQQPMVTTQRWTMCNVAPEQLGAALLQCAGTSFAMLWRIMHPDIVKAQWVSMQASGVGEMVHSGGGGSMSPAINPHSFIRGALNGYLELALRTPACTTSEISHYTVVLLSSISAIQDVLGNVNAIQSPQRAGSTAPGGGKENAALLQLSHQQTYQHPLSQAEQRHMRLCSVGMYDELTAVLSSWMRVVTGLSDASTTSYNTLHRPGEHDYCEEIELKRRTLRETAKSAHVFAAIVSLLTPKAGALIVTVRDYFQWYVDANRISGPKNESQTASEIANEEETHLNEAVSRIANETSTTRLQHIQT